MDGRATEGSIGKDSETNSRDLNVIHQHLSGSNREKHEISEPEELTFRPIFESCTSLIYPPARPRPVLSVCDCETAKRACE